MRTQQGRLPNKPSCPACGMLTDGWTSVGHEGDPRPGSVTLCSSCGTWLVFERFELGLDLRLATDDEVEQIRQDPMAQVAEIALKAVKDAKD
jgi:hypothetical protein